ncbi:MAG: glycosyltransferase family 39 protein [Bacteroides sp.]|nr:glycosyltransferase family 39 protein [Bacteroides sp.]
MNKIKTFVLSHPDLFTVLGLGILFYIIFFHGIGSYALMDVDESRYVLMARDMFHSKDFMTLYLNNEYFFEKPPLYFWGECLSFALFGKVNEFTARFPVALYGASCCYLLYFIGKKIVSRLYGVVAALILATSLEFVILAKFAILDIVVSTCIAFSLCFGVIVYFCRESHKKYYWWLFYIFSALAVMAKGIPGFVVPFGSMFFISIVSKKFKDIFKPQYFIPGIVLFLLIVLPWHIAMFKMYNPLFWDEYIVKHHLARFLGSEVINREQPFYFYFLTLMWGFFPWILSCLVVWGKKIKDKRYIFNFEELTNSQKFKIYNIIIVLFILLFFSSSGTKLITYILPIYGSLSYIAAFIWTDYIEKRRDEGLINITNYILGGLFLLISLGGILTPLYLPSQILADISTVKTFCILSSFAVGLAIILFTKKRKYVAVFTSIVIFMSIFSAHATEKFFEIDYKFGQDDLMEFAKYADEHDVSLTTFNFGHKYSLIYYGGEKVEFGTRLEPEDLEKTLDKDKNMVIIRIKELNKLKDKKYDIIKMGRKFALIEEDE